MHHRFRAAAAMQLIVVAAVLGTAACSGDAAVDAAAGTDGADRAGDTRGTGDTTSASTTPPPRGATGSGEAVTIAFAGDASFEQLDARLQADPEGLLRSVEPVLGAADVSIVNLEAALTRGGGTREPKSFAFRVPPSALTALGAAGADVVTMANNHGMDFGSDGLRETLELRAAADAGVAVIGVGSDAADAYEPYVTEVRGQRIGIIAANDIFDSNLVASWTATDDRPGIASAEEDHQERFADEVRDLRRRVDTLAVYLHFGTEKDTCPHGRQRELVDLLIDAGADIVVGSHAHRLQGLGYLGDRFVAYGLSNFVFKSPSAAGNATGVLTVTATGRRIDGYRWTPAVIRDLVPVPIDGAAADAALAEMDQRRACAGLGTEPTDGDGAP